MQELLGVTPVPRESSSRQTYLRQPDPEVLLRIEQLEVNNSCFWREYHAGDNGPRNRALALILRGFLRPPFFTEMRSNQQLGYIVWAGPTTNRDNFRLYFIIQSSTHAANAIEDRADAFIATYPKQFRELPAKNFIALKTAAAEEVKRKPKSISEKARKFNTLAFDFDADFERDSKTLEQLENITQEQVAAFLQRILEPETRRVRTTLAFAKEHQAARAVENSLGDIKQWKAKRDYR